MKKLLFSAAVSALIASSFSYAGVITNGVACQTSSVTITDITPTLPAGSPSVTGLAYPIHSTSCLGYVTTPDNDWGNGPTPNIGGFQDGLLNEEVKNGYFIPGDQFLTNTNDSMVDLDGDGTKTDPGWIRLGGSEAVEGQSELVFDYDLMNGYDLDTVLNISFNFDGTWGVEVDPTAISLATLALGRPTIFDHLAFVMKGPNDGKKVEGTEDEHGEWAIFDFNFHDLIDDGLDISLGDTAYTFSGTWDANGIFDGQRLSHLSVWAHDPPLDISVPAPATLLLLGIGLLVSRLVRKQ